jgi:hypothetical protein
LQVRYTAELRRGVHSVSWDCKQASGTVSRREMVNVLKVKAELKLLHTEAAEHYKEKDFLK